MNTRPREIYWILGSLLATVALASIIGYALKRRQPLSPAIENLNARIRAWWVMILIGGGALLAGRLAVILLFAFVSFLALREFITQTPVRRADHSAWNTCTAGAIAFGIGRVYISRVSHRPGARGPAGSVAHRHLGDHPRVSLWLDCALFAGHSGGRANRHTEVARFHHGGRGDGLRETGRPC